MSLNALGVSQLARPALSSAGAGTTFSLGAGSYAGLTPANYDVVVGTTGAFVAGVSTVNLSILNVTSVAQAAGCIVECFLQVPLVPQPPIAAAVVQGVKYGGTVVYTPSPPTVPSSPPLSALAVSAFISPASVSFKSLGNYLNKGIKRKIV
jgi:hypothetical protein